MYLTAKLPSTTALLLIFTLLTAGNTKAQHGLANTQNDTLTKSVIIHPVIDGELVSSEHDFNSQLGLGDQLGRDFTVAKMQDDGIPKRYNNKGKENKDWYGWRENVLAPFQGTVTRVEHPEITNTPGTMNRDAQPGLIFFENKNEVTVIYAHAREIKVEEGQKVNTGEIVAKVGNNGNSRFPHIHVGAWKDDTPLQIQVDLYSKKRLEGKESK